ncbi:MAG: DUF2384 domain-containing protein [Bacteroidales bacterium]|nr:DUF2384 domain-containing protein [Bacteroidales bacterium]
MAKSNEILEKKISYDSVDDKDIFYIIDIVRNGIKYDTFSNLLQNIPLNLSEWSYILHLSERTIQRYKRERRTFNLPQSERIIQIFHLYQLGINVFGNKSKFNMWIESENLALGKVKPKELLDNTFGINMLKDELIRIQQGILA